MKTKLKLLALSILISGYGFAQNAAAGQAKFNTEMNNFQTMYGTDNDMFWDWSTSLTKTFIPKYSNSSPIFTGSCWMGGFSNGNLHAAAMTYRQTGIDFWPGPIDTTNLSANASLCSSFDTFFPVRKTQVDSQKNHLYTAGTMPLQITNWPGNGVSANHTSYKLAPYQDVNHNNIYDPVNGDYPIMRGDFSIYQIANDVGNTHSESGGGILGVETHATQYVIECPSDSALWNTMFTHYELINRSANTYTDFYFTMWLDFDLGNYQDDYIACDTLSNMFYVYNGDGNDEDVDALTGYHDHLPAFAGKFLNQKLSVFTAYNNSGDSRNGNPAKTNGLPYYNLMKGVWENGTPMTYGNQGLNTVSVTNPKCNFLFPGDPYTNTGWTEASVASNPPGDRRGLGSCGPYTFGPNDTLKIDFAYIFARDYQHPGDNLACIPILKQYAQNIQNYYNTNTTPCGTGFSAGMQSHTQTNEQIIIYPNPSKGNFSIETNIETAQTVSVYDINGKIVLTQTIYGNTTIDAGSLSNGIYNVSIMGNEGVINKRVVIIK